MPQNFDAASASAEVTYIRENTVAPVSKSIYLASTIKFLAWLFINKRELLTDECVEALSTTTDNAKTILKSFLQRRVPPIKFGTIEARDFMLWIVSLRKENNQPLGYSACNTHRSSFYDLFRSYEQTMSTNLQKELAHHFRGLKRRTAQRISGGDGEIKVGKEPLSIGLYTFLAGAFLRGNTKDLVIAHLFMLICWNLKRYSDLAFLMNRLEERARQDGRWVANASPTQANDIFFACEQAIEVPIYTGQKRRRRIGQMKWISLVKLLRNSREELPLVSEQEGS
jgi:hypothetical protein